MADLTDDELLQVAAAARRQTSWAQARELAAIAELAQRRIATETAETAEGPDYRTLTACESVTEEVAAALTVTGNTAATLVHLAERLTGPLAETGDALESGRIDMAKARVISDITDDLPDQVIARVQAAALDKASVQTTGQLRRRIKRIVQRLAPEAAEERRQQAVRHRRLELWDTTSGTTDLALCDLPPEDAHGIFNKITAAAHGLKTEGDTRPLHLIRADLAAHLLNGAPLPTAARAVLTQATPRDDGTTDDGTVAEPTPPATSPAAGARDTARRGGLAVLPPAGGLAVLPPAGGLGATAADDDPALPGVAAMVNQRLTHLRDRTPAAELPAAVSRTVRQIRHRLASQRDALCQGDGERHGRPGYRPPAELRREIEARHATCVFPTCNQPSPRCDLDHTVPWRPGITCRCNLAPLCRRHHRVKQTPGWGLHHVWPGLLIWTTPSGAWYIVHPERQ
ncbi:HNH endonuclease signature motif containing protein [Actinomadura sp. 7K507]|uniref:HNH endonuclease signature motif containing protein n=1 Tax=Actinomadura sp. 7K507 TaxID=2530365 RepID=UPI0014042B3D|nr:HNH endonuclease signature motif containing protein [Actinomadura sp. 7K507]